MHIFRNKSKVLYDLERELADFQKAISSKELEVRDLRSEQDENYELIAQLTERLEVSNKTAKEADELIKN